MGAILKRAKGYFKLNIQYSFKLIERLTEKAIDPGVPEMSPSTMRSSLMVMDDPSVRSNVDA